MKKRSIRWAVFLVVGIICTILSRFCSKANAEDEWDPLSGDPWEPPEWIVSEAPMPTATPEPTQDPANAEPVQGNLRGSATAVPTAAVHTPLPTDEPLDMAAPDLAYRFKAYFDIGSFSWSNSTPNRVYLTSYRNGVDSRYGDLTPWPIFTDSIATSILSTNGNFKNYYETMYSDVSMNTLSLRYNGVYTSMYLLPRGTIDNTYQMKISLLWLSSLLDLNYPSNANDQAIYDAVQPDDLAYCPVHVFCVITTSSNRVFDYETTFAVSDLILGVSIPIPTDQFLDNDTLASISINLVFNWPPQSNSVIQQFNDYYSANGLTPSYYPTFNYRSASKLKVKVILEEPKEVSKNFISRFFNWLFIPDSQMLSNLFSSSLGDPNTGGSYLALGMRSTLYNHLLSSETPNAVISLPQIDIPLNGNSYRIFNGYSFNLTEFYNGSSGTQGERPPLATLMQAVRFIMTALMFSAFFQSLWAITCGVFGLHWWSGASSEDIAEADV